ncbi:MAG: Do family serine endopeptidase [Alphaproteobacteria bacterium]
MTLLFLCVFITPYGVSAQERIVPDNELQLKLSYAPLVKKVAPAVVNIYTKRTVQTGFRSPFMSDPFFEQFFGGSMFGGGMRERVENSLGSGVIVAKEGLVITNAHVVRGAQEITVVMPEGNEYAARLLLSDDASDLAVLRIEEDKEFPYVTLKPSESLEVGDLVLAIGNPFGVGQTVTSGIVSAQGRSSLDINDYNFFIQTDAAINPGNSGGALVAMDGGVVGINTAIMSRSGGSMGLGFAIPSEMVASVIAAALSGQTGDKGITRPWLGVTTQNVTSDIANSLGLEKPMGSLIADLHSASPLLKAGVKISDVVTQVNGHIIRDAPEMKFRLATVPLGKTANVKVLRQGRELSFDIAAITPPDDPPRNEVTLKGAHILSGAVIANLNPAVAVELGLKGEDSGVVVIETPRGSYAARAVTSGDIILEINGQKIESPEDVDTAFENSESGASLIIKRGGRVSRIFMR